MGTETISATRKGRKTRTERIPTCSIRGKSMLQVDYLSLLPTLLYPAEQGINPLLDNGLQPHDSLLGKDRIPSCSAFPMEVMVSSSYGRHIRAEALSLPVPDISFLFIGIYLIVKLGIRNMNFFGIDSNDRAVLSVQFAYFEDILATVNAVIEKFVPTSILGTIPMIAWGSRPSYQYVDAANFGPGNPARG